VVESFRSGQQTRVDTRKTLHLHRGLARFTGRHRVKVGDELLEGERIFIDTGARPAIPPLPGLETTDYLTNASIMELGEIWIKQELRPTSAASSR
jgi:pyruvate/2-oxoglutarate dehydrogenase complex dihydrolipoamide dehydrogenase (E3) component